MKPSTLVLGAGPAGLTAAYLLSKEGYPVTVLEKDPADVGGISRTVHYKGFGFDIGGHRFFSKSREIEALWTEILPHDMLERPRLSRIYYDRKFFSYPLKGGESLRKLGIIPAALCVLSYLKARICPIRDPKTFEEWVSNEFGARLFRTFFKTYTEKVWGMKCSEISADWAAQRIKGLSLSKAVLNAFRPSRPGAKPRTTTAKTLIDSFRYPRHGPGMLWQACAERVRAQGGQVILGTEVRSCAIDSAAGTWSVHTRSADGTPREFRADHIISTAPLRELISGLHPAVSPEAAAAAASLRYRDFLTVALIVRDRGLMDDTWIYIHDPSVKVARIQNFKAWSPEMVPDPALNCYGLEYFCFEGDGLWTAADSDLIEFATAELVAIGLAAREDILDAAVVRQPKAYPVYDDGYRDRVALLRAELAAHYPGLHVVGRNGMHKYNNQDHSMMTALLCARNIMAGEARFDVWNVNEDAEYHESGAAGQEELGMRHVPRRATPG